MRDWNDPFDLIPASFMAFPASILTWHISLPGTSEQRNTPTRFHVHIHAHTPPPCSLSLFPGCTHAETHICHLHGDSRGIGALMGNLYI